MYRLSIGGALVGAITGALLLRLVALLFAARPDHPFVAILLALTAPLTAPFRALDRYAGQPQIGARLELATLAALVIVLVIAGMAQWWFARSRADQQEKSYAQSERPDRKSHRSSDHG